MLAAVQMNDSGVVDHLGVHDDRVLRLHDLVVAVVGVREHGRPRSEERQTLILKAGVLRALATLDRVEAAALHRGRFGCEGRNASIGWIGDDGGPQRLDGASAELPVERVVGAGAGIPGRRLGRRLLVVLSDLAFPLRGLFGREEGLVLQQRRAFERCGGGGVPDAVEACADVRIGAALRGEQRRQRHSGHGEQYGSATHGSTWGSSSAR